MSPEFLPGQGRPPLVEEDKLRVPAVCDQCGSIFPSAIEVDNAINISFSGCGSGPCPACGGMGHIPDGLYNFINNTIELVSGPHRTVSDLERLAKLLREARNQKFSYEEVTRSITSEIPELSSFKDILPKTRNELYAFIAIILTIITIALSQRNKLEDKKIEVNQVINNIVYQQLAPSQSVQSQAPPSKISSSVTTVSKNKIGRNDPCPCGSGKKFKKCCLP